MPLHRVAPGALNLLGVAIEFSFALRDGIEQDPRVPRLRNRRREACEFILDLDLVTLKRTDFMRNPRRVTATQASECLDGVLNRVFGEHFGLQSAEKVSFDYFLADLQAVRAGSAVEILRTAIMRMTAFSKPLRRSCWPRILRT